MQQTPDTGQHIDSAPRPRTSSIPRPTILTNVDSFQARHQPFPSSPRSAIPAALQYKARRNSHATPNASPLEPRSAYGRTFDRPSVRSASGPSRASGPSSPASARTASHLQKASFKDLVARFNQSPDQEPISPASNYTRGNSNSSTAVSSPASRGAWTTGPPSAVDPSPTMNGSSTTISPTGKAIGGAAPLLKYDSSLKPPQDGSRIARPATAEQRHERSVSQFKREPLFGEVVSGQADLSSLGYGVASARRRRDSDGSMREPNAMFPRASTAGSPAHSRGGSQASSNGDGLRPSPQTRSKSDYASRAAAAAVSQPGSSPSRSSQSSRIPKPSPSSSGMLAKGSRNQANSFGDRRPQTPPSLQIGVDGLRTGRSMGDGQSLSVVVNAPIPHKSPPLRSSRPRQDVNSAQSVSPEGRRRPHDVPLARLNPNVDVVTRQQSIRRAMMADRFIRQSWIEGASPPDVRTSGDRSATSRIDEDEEFAASKGKDASQDSLAQLPSTTYQRPGQNLKVNVPVEGKDGEEEDPDTATTQFEEDALPSTGMPGTFPEAEPSKKEDATAQTQRAESEIKSVQTSPQDVVNSFPNRSRTILSQVMEMRKRGNTGRSSMNGPLSPSPRSDGDDTGTIHVMLAGSPAAGQSNSNWYQQELHQSSGQPRTSSVGEGEDDSRESSYNDYHAPINRILDQYHQSGIVSPDMVYEFQKFLLEVDPELSGKDEAETMAVARTALEDIIRDFPTTSKMREGAMVHSPESNYSFSPGSDTARFGNSPTVQLRDDRDVWSGTSVPRLETSNRGTTTSSEGSGPTPPPKDGSFTSPGARSDRTSVSDRTSTSISTVKGRPISNISSTLNTPALQDLLRTNGTVDYAGDETSPTNLLTEDDMRPFPAFLSTSTSSPSDSARANSSDMHLSRRDGSIADSISTTDASTYSPASVSQDHPAFKNPALKPSPLEEGVDVAGLEASILSEHRRLTKRKHLIKELIDTEASYNQDMKVIEDIYKGTASACDAVTAEDSRVLFGNSGNIVDFSETFLAALKQAGASMYVMPRSNKWRQNRGSISTSNSTNTQTEAASMSNVDITEDEKDRKTTIGHVFNQHISRMEELYTTYLRNHEYANQRLRRLQEVSKVKLWLHECHTYAADITSAWDLDSLLVKPVQRILKYPLLLRGLLETTPEDHPDYFALMLASQHMIEASGRMNESKKRAEVVDQVMKVQKRKDFDISKLVSRRSDKLKAQIGLSDAVEDPEYKRLAQRFETRYVHLQIVMRDFEYYKKNTEEFMQQFRAVMRCVEQMITVGHSNSPELESKWRKLVLTIQDMHAIAHADHDAAVVKHCINPIISLIKLHEGPQKLMMKRKKRIVEYAKYFTMKNRGEKIDRKTQEQGDQFIALNETLKDELPKLFQLSSRLIETCLRNFIDLQKQWHSIWQRKVRTVVEDHQIPNSMADIVESFNHDFHYVETHVLALGICNGSLLAEISNYLSSSSASLLTDDNTLSKRPSMQHSQTTQDDYSPVVSEYDRRASLGLNAPAKSSRSSTDSQARAHQASHGHGQASYQDRFRAPSNASNTSSRPRNSSARREPHKSAPAPFPYIPHQESRQQWSSDAPQASHHASAPSNLAQTIGLTRPTSESTFYSATAGGPNGSPHIGATSARLSGVFSSAMPMSDSPVITRPSSPEPQTTAEPSAAGTSEAGPRYQTLFTAASLYDFRIADERFEGGYPYLFYSPGEIFDVIGQKGELWLAKNQDDESKKVGWIWEKHFYRLNDV